MERFADGEAEERFVSRMVYDPLDRLVRSVDSVGQIHEFLHDSRNNIVVHLDAARSAPDQPGNRTRSDYDDLDRLVSTTIELRQGGQGGGALLGEITTRREWDDASRLKAVIDANGNRTEFDHDAHDRVTGIRYADGTQRRLEHDARGNVVRETDPRQTVITTVFDGMSRATGRTVEPGPGVAGDTTFERWSYDGRGQVVRAVNDGSDVALAYDSLGQLTRDAMNGVAVVRTHDGLGNPVETVYPTGRRIRATHDSLERLAALHEVMPGGESLIASQEFRGRDRIGQRTLGNGTRMEVGYDAARRPSRITHRGPGGGLINDRTYEWDSNDNRAAENRIFPANGRRTLGYDSAHRLVATTSTEATEGTVGYGLDVAGNRTLVTGGVAGGSYSMAPPPASAGRLNQYSETPAGVRTHDLNGNLASVTSGGTSRELAYDFRNRLVEFQHGDEVTRFAYDALGRRIAKIRGEAATDIRWYRHFQWEVVEEVDGQGNLLASLVHGHGASDLISIRDGAGVLFLHADDQAHVQHVTDGSGAVVESYRHDVFGAVTVLGAGGQELDPGAARNRKHYGGYEQDPETGLYHVRHRYYEPLAGRFITRDPAGAWNDPMAMGNAYAYAGNNPATFTDPSGLAASKVRSVARPASVAATMAANTLHSKALEQAGRLDDLATAARVDALTKGTEISRTLEGVYKRLVRGDFLDAVEGVGNYDLKRIRLSPKDAAVYVDRMFNGKVMNPFRGEYGIGQEALDYGPMIRKKAYFKDTFDTIAELEAKGARLAQQSAKASRFAKVTRALGVAGIGLQTGLDLKDNIDNCASGTVIAADAAGTIGANTALMYANPALGIADAVTGGSVSASLGNLVRVAAILPRGRVSVQEQRAIKATLTRSPVTSYVYGLGERFARWREGP